MFCKIRVCDISIDNKSCRMWKVLLLQCWLGSTLRFVFVIVFLIGFSLLLDVFCALHGPREKCVEILRSGHLLAISPGGVREALLSDETYNIVWGNRKGFAQVAIDAKAVSRIRLIFHIHLVRWKVTLTAPKCIRIW